MSVVQYLEISSLQTAKWKCTQKSDPSPVIIDYAGKKVQIHK